MANDDYSPQQASFRAQTLHCTACWILSYDPHFIPRQLKPLSHLVSTFLCCNSPFRDLSCLTQSAPCIHLTLNHPCHLILADKTLSHLSLKYLEDPGQSSLLPLDISSRQGAARPLAGRPGSAGHFVHGMKSPAQGVR